MKLANLFLIVALWTARAGAMDAPPDVRAAMKPNGISLMFETLNIGPNRTPIEVHLYVVPRGRDNAGRATLGMEPKTGPITRNEIGGGETIKMSPYYLEMFSRRGAALKKLKGARFEQNKAPSRIFARWLDPKTKRAPVVVVRFDFPDAYSLTLLTFARGITQAAQVQEFSGGGESGYFSVQSLDKTDARGLMMVSEQEGEPDKPTIRRAYTWDGQEFRDFKARYFVIAATTKTQAQAEAIQRKHGFGEVRASERYARLRRGYYILIVARFAAQKEAARHVAELKTSGINAYVRRAF